MNNSDVLNNLQKRSNCLKSKLLHEKLKYGNVSSDYFKKYSLLVVDEFKHEKSLCKSALNIGINPVHVLNWYIQGQLNNPVFKSFYLEINKLNGLKSDESQQINKLQNEEIVTEIIDGEYVISEYGDGWSYKTFINGEKIFIISNTFDGLKQKVKNEGLPLD